MSGLLTRASPNTKWDAANPSYTRSSWPTAWFAVFAMLGRQHRLRQVHATSTLRLGTPSARTVKSFPGWLLLGIPTERLRWFTQIGNGRPSVRSGFTVDAEKAARSALIVAREVHTV